MSLPRLFRQRPRELHVYIHSDVDVRALAAVLRRELLRDAKRGAGLGFQ